MLGVFLATAIATGALLFHQSQQPHTSALGEGEGPSTPVTQLSPTEATRNLPPADVTDLKTITRDALTKVTAGDQKGATSRASDLETAWDDKEGTLKPLNATAWTFLDKQVDGVLTAIRQGQPDPQAETEATTALLTSLN